MRRCVVASTITCIAVAVFTFANSQFARADYNDYVYLTVKNNGAIINASTPRIGHSRLAGAKRPSRLGLMVTNNAGQKRIHESHVHKRETAKQGGQGITIPGTKWCGKGDVAAHDNDLGNYAVEDACCRTHDHCDTQKLISGQKRTFYTQSNKSYSIINEHIYEISHCECNEAFKRCLEAANSPKGDEIGYWFFNWFHPKCLTYDHPVACVEHMFYYWGPCTRQVPDISREKQWYLHDVSYFKDASREEPPVNNKKDIIDDDHRNG